MPQNERFTNPAKKLNFRYPQNGTIGLINVTSDCKFCSIAVIKPTNMKAVLLFKDIYVEAFKNLGNYLVKHFFKVFSIVTLILFCMVLYAFIYRLSTGFAF